MFGSCRNIATSRSATLSPVQSAPHAGSNGGMEGRALPERARGRKNVSGEPSGDTWLGSCRSFGSSSARINVSHRSSCSTSSSVLPPRGDVLGLLLGQERGHNADVDVRALEPAALDGLSSVSLKVCALIPKCRLGEFVPRAPWSALDGWGHTVASEPGKGFGLYGAPADRRAHKYPMRTIGMTDVTCFCRERCASHREITSTLSQTNSPATKLAGPRSSPTLVDRAFAQKRVQGLVHPLRHSSASR
jgi:hypothetical protein